MVSASLSPSHSSHSKAHCGLKANIENKQFDCSTKLTNPKKLHDANWRFGLELLPMSINGRRVDP